MNLILRRYYYGFEETHTRCSVCRALYSYGHLVRVLVIVSTKTYDTNCLSVVVMSKTCGDPLFDSTDLLKKSVHSPRNAMLFEGIQSSVVISPIIC